MGGAGDFLVKDIRLSRAWISDIARAAIQLAMRDAEMERNAVPARPCELVVHRNPDNLPLEGSSSDEKAFYKKICPATGYERRVRRMEMFIYRALAACNVDVVRVVATGAPQAAPCTICSRMPNFDAVARAGRKKPLPDSIHFLQRFTH